MMKGRILSLFTVPVAVSILGGCTLLGGGGDADLHFDFVSCGNLDSPSESHMHEASFTFVDANTLRAHWTLYERAKPELKRVDS